MISVSNVQLQQQLEYTLLNPDCHSWWISKMQSGREDTLEERYAIKLCFKLGKNVTKTYGILQTAFGPSYMNQASVFEWHKRFKEGRESVRDYERCRWSKKVRTPELIGQIKNLMDKDRRVSIETIRAQFDVSVGTVHTIIHEKLKMRKICTKFVPRVLREDQKERHCYDSREMVELINSDSAVLDALMTCDESWIYCNDQETKRQISQWEQPALPDPRRPDRANPPTNFWWSLFLTAQGVQEAIPREEASTLQIGPVPFPPVPLNQSTTASLSRAIWARWASRQFITPPIVQTLLPVTFAYSISSRKNLEAVVMRQPLSYERGCDEGQWHAHTKWLPWGLPEVVGTVQVHCSRRTLLRKWLEFHVCTTNKSTPTKKYGNLFNEPCINNCINR